MKAVLGVFAVSGAMILSGCAGLKAINEPEPSTARFGDAVRMARIKQTLNPDASKNLDPVTGIDARAARSSSERYHDSFKAPPPTFEILNVPAIGR